MGHLTLREDRRGKNRREEKNNKNLLRTCTPDSYRTQDLGQRRLNHCHRTTHSVNAVIEYRRRSNTWNTSKEATSRRKDMKITEAELDAIERIARSSEKISPQSLKVSAVARILIIMRVEHALDST